MVSQALWCWWLLFSSFGNGFPSPLVLVALVFFAGAVPSAPATPRRGLRPSNPILRRWELCCQWHMPRWHAGNDGGDCDFRADTSIRPYGGNPRTWWRNGRRGDSNRPYPAADFRLCAIVSRSMRAALRQWVSWSVDELIVITLIHTSE
jgi:hypothetical protein